MQHTGVLYRLFGGPPQNLRFIDELLNLVTTLGIGFGPLARHDLILVKLMLRDPKQALLSFKVSSCTAHGGRTSVLAITG